MRTTVDFLTYLNHLDVKVWGEGDALRYNAPQGVMSPELLQELIRHKHEILKMLQAKESLPTVTVDLAGRHDPFPLSIIQRAYWLGRSDAFELGQVSAHVYAEVECMALDPERLSQAFQKLIDRHEMLRAVIRPDGRQTILQSVPHYRIEFADLRGETPAVVESHFNEVRDQLSHLCLPADQWPLFVIRGTRYGDSAIRLHISLDGLSCDMFSIMLLAREWYAFYQNPAYAPPPLALSFRDYLLTEQTLLDSDLYKRSRQYWLNRLDTLPPAPELPLACMPVTIKKPRFTRRAYAMPALRWQPLKNRLTRQGLTPSGFLLATFAEVLNVWSKNSHFTINVSLFNRLNLHEQVNEIVGDFTTLTLFEADLSTPDTFLNRALRLQNQLWQDLDHRYFSGITVIGELLKRDKGERTVFPVVFTSGLALDLPGDEMEALNSFAKIVYGLSQTPQVWLDYIVMENNGALVLAWDAVEGLFPDGLLNDMFEAYQLFLNELLDSESAMEQRFRQWLPPAQFARRQQLNATAAPASPELLHTLFMNRVKVQGNEPAVITPQYTLTYQELFERATEVGNRLRRMGAAPNTLVAVSLEKGWEQVVAVLGILISGAAYLPVDPNLPEERQHYLLQQGEVKIVVTQPQLGPGQSFPETIQQLVIRKEYSEGIALDPVQIPNQSPDDLAYVIYTSGSTGLPKGVMIDHRGAVNTLLDINDRYQVGPGDRVLALSALNFDLSVYDIFGMLAAGGTIVFPDPDRTKDPAHWAELISTYQVTIWDTVPALMQMLAGHLQGTPLPAPFPLRLVLLSGDWIPLDLPAQIKDLFGEARVISQGGATEASIWSVFYPIERLDPTWKSIPYGKPLTNQTLQVLSPQMEPCPVWVPGAIHIGGLGLAKGYWRDEQKTRSSFITHPRTQERLYRTGDLGRYLPDGNIEFLGREDFQVKIGGFRIELGEIEALLKEHSQVKDAVVKAVGEKFGPKQLVAYVIPEQESAACNSGEEVFKQDKGSGVVMAPLERLQFRLNQPGIRPTGPTERCVPLPQPELDETRTRKYLRRQSYRIYGQQPISRQDFSYLLSSLQQIRLDSAPLPKYLYPSAGNLYPVQTYLYLKAERIEGLEGGFYYYHPKEHQLVLLGSGLDFEPELPGLYDEFNRPFFNNAAFCLFLVGRLDAIRPLYGDYARDFCLLEAGYMSQLLMTVGPDHGLGLCPIGSMEFTGLRDYFGLDGNQILLHSFVGGKIEPAQTKQWGEPRAMANEESLTTGLKDYAGRKLPGYMIPSCFIMLADFPLTANGKVDRKALKDPDQTALAEKVSYDLPRNEMEERLAEIVRDILAIEKVGVNNNFFELGADSIQIIRIHNRLKQTLASDLTIVVMFQKPTIRLLVEHIARNREAKPDLRQNTDRANRSREFFRRQRDNQ